MYDPKSNNGNDKNVKPAPYADAAVNDEGLTSPENKNEFSEDIEDDDDSFDEVHHPAEIEEIEIEDIEIEDIDDSYKRADPGEAEDFEE